MAVLLKCLKGHQWEATPGGKNTCPQCGAAAIARDEAQRPTVKPEVSTPSLSDSSNRTSLPEQFGRYRILKQLGKGGMGSVYLAHDTELDRKVALKVPHFTEAEGKNVRDRFYREARSAATLHHANICPVYDVGEMDGTLYLTMAYIEGESLSRFVDPNKPLTQRQVATLVRKLALALQEAHSRGVIHRDLKPSNVMISKRGEPVVMDFGLARRTTKGEVRLTQTGAIIGTPAYMSPEQVNGDLEAMGPQSDVYSLGVILYELLAGRLPFEGPMASVLAQIIAKEPVPPSMIRPGVDPALEAVCLKAMAKSIPDRMRSMADFAAALGEFLKATAVGPAGSGARPEAAFAGLTDDVRVLKTRSHKPGRSSGPPRLPTARGPSLATKFQGRLRKTPLVWRWVALVAFVLVLGLGGVVFYVVTDTGTIQIELLDAKADVEVQIDGQSVTIQDGERRISLRAGKHLLKVAGPGYETRTEEFTVKRGENPVLRVKLLPAQIPVKPPATPEKPPGVAVKPKPTDPDPPKDVPPADETGFVSIFNGKDLDGWETGPKGTSFSVDPDGNLLAAGEPAGVRWLLTKKRYTDYVLRLEFQIVRGPPYHTNSGVALRALPGIEGPNGRKLDVAIRTVRTPPLANAAVRFASDEAVESPDPPATRPAGDWNMLEIEVRGSRVIVSMNGKLANDADLSKIDRTKLKPQDKGWVEAALDRKAGQIGLPSAHGPIKFRNIRVKDLSKSAAADPDRRAAERPADASSYRGKFYKVYPEVLTWKEARKKCRELGGDLAVVLDDAHNQFLMGLVRARLLDEAWLGASDEAKEGEWLWVDGSPMRYGNWFPGQPNNKQGLEHYAVMLANRDGKWSDQPDRSDQHRPGFICQWESDALPKPEPPPMVTPSPGFTRLFNGRDLTGWRADSGQPADWKTENSQMVVSRTPDMPSGWLVTEKEYGDYVLRLQFQLTPGSQSGVALRAAGDGSPRYLEVQLCDDTSAGTPNAVPTGTLVWAAGAPFLPPDPAAALKPLGEWNDLVIELREQTLRVLVNGKSVRSNDLAYLSKQPGALPDLQRSKGRIGLQAQAGTARFRNIEIQELATPLAQEAKPEPPRPQPANPEALKPEPPQPAPVVPLFNRKNLNGWVQDGGAPGAWRAANAFGEQYLLFSVPSVGGPAPNTAPPQSGWLLTEKSYADFVLTFEYRLERKANSGVTFRALPGEKHIEIQLLDDDTVANTTQKPEQRSGSLWNLVPAKALQLKGSNDWNKMEMELKGRNLRVTLNGRETLNVNLDQVKPPPVPAGLKRASGRIGFQHWEGTGRFRNIEIQDLSPEPAKPAGKAPAKPARPQVTLFDGKSLAQWIHPDGQAANWQVGNGFMTVGKGNIRTKQEFAGDHEVHVEFLITQPPPNARGQGRGNSGVYIQGRYEVQILDSYGIARPTVQDCGAVYGQHAPEVNGCKPPGQWQTFDITFRAPKFAPGGTMTQKPRISVLHNGFAVINNVEIDKAGGLALDNDMSKPGPLLLQDHGQPVLFRNIWVRPLE